MNKSKYLCGLRLLCFLGKCSKYIYYTKKLLCFGFIILSLCIGISAISGGKCRIKALKGMF